MHLAVDGELPDSISDLADQPGTACVAACYRCLMSYYNQPDHESLDRRDEDARTMLLRLARASTAQRARTQPIAATLTGAPGEVSAAVSVSREDRWLAEAARRDFPAPDSEPFVAGTRSVRCVWRKHYVAAVIDEVDRPALQPMEDLGFEVIEFDDPERWNTAFARLASALGQAS